MFRSRAHHPRTEDDRLARIYFLPSEPAESRRPEGLPLSALRVGLISLRHTRGQIDSESIQHEGERLLLDLRQALELPDAVGGQVVRFPPPTRPGPITHNATDVGLVHLRNPRSIVLPDHIRVHMA